MRAGEATEDQDVEDAWLDEITDRLDEHDRGASPPIPADIVFAAALERVTRARG
jgi:hypothetical protein